MRLAATIGATLILAGCGASQSGYSAVPPGEEVSGERCYEGEWHEQDDSGLQRFAFRLRVSVQGDRATGHFDWRAIELSSLPRLVGRRAREVLAGRFEEGRLILQGTQIHDPLAGQMEIIETFHGQVGTPIPPFMSVDRYRVAVSGDRVVGRSRTHEHDWSGTLQGQRVECDPASSLAER